MCVCVRAYLHVTFQALLHSPPLPQLFIEGVGGGFKNSPYLILNPPLCHGLQTVQFESHHSDGLLHQSVEPVLLCYLFLHPSTPQQNSVLATMDW